MGTGLFVHHRIVSAVKRVNFVIDRTSYIVLIVLWYNIIVLNVQAKSEEKSEDSKDIYDLTNVCKIISNTIITNNTLLHVSTLDI